MIDYILAMLINEGTSSTIAARLVALGIGIIAAMVAAGVLLAGQWCLRRIEQERKF